jgi:hypothetical protein
MKIIFPRCRKWFLGFGLLAAALASLSACRDAGGGPAAADGQAAKRSGAKRGLRLLQASLDSAPYTLASSASEKILQTGRFGLPSDYVNYPSGEQIIGAASASGAPLFSFAVPLDVPARQTVLVYGSQDDSGVNAALLSDDPGEIPDGMSAVRVINGVDGAGEIRGTAGAASAGDNVPLGGASAYVYAAGGVQPVQIASSRGAVLFSAVVELKPGRAYSLWAAGEAGYFVAGRLLED